MCANAVAPARFPRIHTFIATSDIHMKHKLKKSREQVKNDDDSIKVIPLEWAHEMRAQQCHHQGG